MNRRLYGILFLFFIFIISGCSQDEGQEEPIALEDRTPTDRMLQVENSSPVENEALTNQEIAAHLANLASGVPGVNSSQAVVAGPYAVVAIDVDEDLDRSRVGTIKYSVGEALYHDAYGKTAVVVADADAAERVRRMREQIEQGYPVQGVVEELAAIVGRYMPSFPVPHDQPDQPDQNKEMLTDEEEQLLEDVEDEQSNHQNN